MLLVCPPAAFADTATHSPVSQPVLGKLVYGRADCVKNCVQGYAAGDQVIFFTVGAFGDIIRAETVVPTDSPTDSRGTVSTRSGGTRVPAEKCHNARMCQDNPKTPTIRTIIYMAATPAGPGMVSISTQVRYIVTATNGSLYGRGDIYNTSPISTTTTSSDNYNGPLDGQFRPANDAVGVSP
ncbi:hypothetical protein D3260_15225 [Salinisphaera sp. Q1T1-3]|nr:hypothetical protein D3260_15225 [Salinisphaera sp. Q1T1-3]